MMKNLTATTSKEKKNKIINNNIDNYMNARGSSVQVTFKGEEKKHRRKEKKIEGKKM